MHHIWIWICNQLYGNKELQDTNLDFEMLTNKWHQLASMEYIKLLKEYKSSMAKEPERFNDINSYNNNIKIIKNRISKKYCILRKSLPNNVIVDFFI
ncbi:hypothetical protein RB653_007402 [Dictyostelium firmibasis]|uniref:Uncharacterized protein n=1 Tax=Dictyostelium firmibasis TaxID=79012 RepID=A0AAN7YRA2_9MYCE